MGAGTPCVIGMERIETMPLVKELIDKFKQAFDCQPEFVVRVPGRVNLIGEHIDYCGYSVLPMALEKHILMAGRCTHNSTLKIVNLDPKYPPFEGNIEHLTINTDHGVQWHSYALCGIRGIAEDFHERSMPGPLFGMLMAVTGDIPPNSGLSSSSALVCAAALTTVTTNRLPHTKPEVATVCAKSEKYIGTEGGGMDQAIALLASPGCAKLISFKPLNATDVIIPRGLAIVVAHSLAELNKAASDHFNHRVAECRLASVVLARKNGISDWKQKSVLADLQSELKMNLSQMVTLIKNTLCKDIYSKDEICELLELSSDEVNHRFLPENTRDIKEFKLCQRAMHVAEEALRVQKFQEICSNRGSGEKLGQLMNSSHDSLRDLYECSHPQLDELVSIARESGALGARLTGAGWGGCMVALTTEEHVDTLISSLREKYYSLKATASPECVFHSRPGNGATIFRQTI